MLTVKTNISRAFGSLAIQLMSIADKAELTKEVAVNLLPEVKVRIHQEGQTATGDEIGTYTNEYLKLRTGNYGNSDKKTKGKSKGELKNSGVFTKGVNKGSARPNYNRTADPKVVLSLTRQTENDFSVQPTDVSFGLGYNNIENYNKAIWNEKRYGKLIFGLTEQEKHQAFLVAENFVNNAIH